MTTSQNPQPSNPNGPNTQGPEQPFLSLHTTVVLLTAIVIGLIVGGLTVFTGVPVATAVLTGLAAAGASVSVLRSLIR